MKGQIMFACVCAEAGEHVHSECRYFDGHTVIANTPTGSDRETFPVDPDACRCDLSGDVCGFCGDALIPGLNTAWCSLSCEESWCDLASPTLESAMRISLGEIMRRRS